MWRSSASAAPRAVARELSIDTPQIVSGAFDGRLTCTASREIAESCAYNAPAAISAPPMMRTNGEAEALRLLSSVFCLVPLLRIYLRHSHVARLRIHVTRPHCSLRVHRMHDVGHLHARMNQLESLIPASHLDPVARGPNFRHRGHVHRPRIRLHPFPNHPRHNHRKYARECQYS